MTIRTFIAEDEPLTLRSIRQSIEQTNEAYRVVGQATDGQSALKLIRETEPDVVFTDIRMPLVDGLGLVRQLKAEGCRSVFVLLSGYKEFEYAKEAITLGVEEYLIKPINPAQLESVLAQVQSKLDGARRVRQHDYLEHRRDEPLPAGLFDPGRSYWMVSVCVGAYRRNPLEPVLGADRLMDLDKWIASLSGDRLYWLLNGKCPNEKIVVWEADTAFPIAELADGLAAKIGRFAERDVPAALFYGTAPTDIAALPARIAALEQAMRERLVFGESVVAGIDRDAGPAAAERLPDEFGEDLRLLKTLAAKDKEQEIRLLFKKMLRASREHHLTQPLLLKLLRQVCQILIARSGLEIEPRDAAEDLIASSAGYEDLGRLLEAFSREVAHPASEIRALDKGSERILDDIQAYMDAHFHTELSIQGIAASFGFNYSYLCSLFKKYKHRTPNEYIIEKRIEKAKQLLRTTDLSIKAVASFVGYEDPYYFSRIFKTVAGVTPSGYRKAAEA
ncbi:Helix-turn-helix domain-containing protein [Cohnella sp. OV330]|uniref:helix-turn-helix domain-containing protein n=1 Tax=Cohnella sp. OV330 TaxID=1855288 RepID=UPI0008E174EF|nr:helix-turn-helix domain-containing protein [Cohnella sp. OV330]SFB05954.1 Helix-turn-helix domain-containing protein [Cohnella sp. OV330]